MTDREIAEDLLAGQKYLSNYYYAPAILEAGDPRCVRPSKNCTPVRPVQQKRL